MPPSQIPLPRRRTVRHPLLQPTTRRPSSDNKPPSSLLSTHHRPFQNTSQVPSFMQSTVPTPDNNNNLSSQTAITSTTSTSPTPAITTTPFPSPESFPNDAPKWISDLHDRYPSASAHYVHDFPQQPPLALIAKVVLCLAFPIVLAVRLAFLPFEILRRMVSVLAHAMGWRGEVLRTLRRGVVGFYVLGTYFGVGVAAFWVGLVWGLGVGPVVVGWEVLSRCRRLWK